MAICKTSDLPFIPVMRMGESTPSTWLNIDDGEMYEIRQQMSEPNLVIKKIPLLGAGNHKG